MVTIKASSLLQPHSYGRVHLWDEWFELIDATLADYRLDDTDIILLHVRDDPEPATLFAYPESLLRVE